MNKANVLRAIAVLDALPPQQLKMDKWHCGTAVCFAGSLADSQYIPEVLWSNQETRNRPGYISHPVHLDDRYIMGSEAIAKFLDIPSESADNLCGVGVDQFYPCPLQEVTKAMVLTALRDLIDTKEVYSESIS